MSNVKHSGSAVGREFESEVLVEEEMLDGVVCSREQFSFQVSFKSGHGSGGTFGKWRQRVNTRLGSSNSPSAIFLGPF